LSGNCAILLHCLLLGWQLRCVTLKKEEQHSVVTNRRARFEYFVLETLEVGIVLCGTEVKSIRGGKINLQDSYASVDKGELFLYNLHISPFEKGNIFNHNPLRIRKLLAHKREIGKLAAKVNEKGLTLVPIRIYFLNRRVKIDLGVCKGKKLYDKRQTIKDRETHRDLKRFETEK
jgi:SsrA-binding protein